MSLITLKGKNGHNLHISELFQRMTYAGLYLGRPDEDYNQELIKRFVENAEFRWRHVPNYLIQPKIRFTGHKDPYPRLPEVECMAYVDGYTKKYWGHLVILWMQEKVAPPIDEEIIAHIESLDWEELAGDGDP